MQVIVGAGPIGSRTALLLAQRGEEVRVISRSGRGPVAEGIELVAADAADPAKLTELTKGAVAIYNCANPAYHTWLTDWPPLAASLLQAAEANEALLVTFSNLYGYGPVDGPITATTPMRAEHPKLRVRRQMWEEALAAHQTGRVRVTEARASDFIGSEANSVLADMVIKRTVNGKSAFVLGDPDAPHSWTNVDDVAKTLVAIAGDERAWGKAWLVPTAAPLSVRAAAERANELVGAKKAKVTSLPYWVLWSMGLFSKVMKELRATYYQFAQPFVVDSSLTERTFGLAPTPIDDSLRASARIDGNR